MVAKGQHFLKNEKLLRKIPSYANLNSNDVVLEIGSADGNLTKYLTDAEKVYAVELDERLFEELEENFKDDDSVVTVNEDILKYDFPEDVNKVIGNLPYEISSPLLEKILKFVNDQERRGLEDVLMVAMFQEEFARRMTSFPGLYSYSRLTVLCDYFSECEILQKVTKGEFRPPPKVDSALIKLVPKGVEYDEDLFKLFKILFMHKNKKIINSLMDSREYLKVDDKEVLAERLGEIKDKRVWFADVHDFREIRDKIGDLIDAPNL